MATLSGRAGLAESMSRFVLWAPHAVSQPAKPALFGRRAATIGIDDFTAAVATRRPPGIGRSSLGSVTVIESNLAGVIGGVRQVTVAMTSAATPADYVMAGASTAFGALDYSSTPGAAGHFELVYDRGGIGLDANFSRATVLRMAVAAGDADASRSVITVTLMDTALRTGSSSQMVAGRGPQVIDFRLSIFERVDRTRIFGLTILVCLDKAANLQLGCMETCDSADPNPNANRSTAPGSVIMIAERALLQNLYK
jgi:hypothetical protein